MPLRNFDPTPDPRSPLPVTDISPLITAIDEADSPDRLIGAVQALAATRSEAGIPTLIKALGFNNPGAAVVAVKGLVQMGDVAVEPLLNLLDDYNYGARAYAIRALAAIADPRALEVLLSAAETDFAPSVRRAATKGIGLLRWSKLPNDQAEVAQTRVLKSLFKILEDSDWSLRYAAVVGLQALAIASSDLRSQSLQRFHHLATTESDLAVLGRLRWAIASIQEAIDLPTPIPNP